MNQPLSDCLRLLNYFLRLILGNFFLLETLLSDILRMNYILIFLMNELLKYYINKKSEILLNICFVFFLQIGLAVGDIDSIQQNAEYKRLSVKVICSLVSFKVQISLNGV